MTIFAKKPLTNSTVTVSSITNSLGGASGLLQQQITDGDVDNGFYRVNLPWNVNLNGVLYDDLYVSTKSFISFGTAAVNASPTSPETNKILLGNRQNTSVFDTYAKNFYADTEGVTGSRTFRMRYEGGFKVLPTNITSTSLTNNLLGRASLQEYQLNTAFEIPWNINFNTSEGTVQNTILVSEYSQILFGKFNLINSTNQFEANGNALNIGYAAASSGSGVWAGVEGVSPNRTYRIRYEGFDDSNIPTVWEVTLYENNKNIVDIQTGNVTDFFTLDLNGWYSDYNTTLVVDLTNTSGNYNNGGTRLSQSYPSSSFIWEVITYENDTNRIDVQLGSRNNPGSDNHYFGVYSSNSSLYQFPTISNAGYRINSTYDVPAWATINNIYSKVTPLGLSSSWQPVKNVYIKESGVWKMVHPVGGSGGSEPVYFFCKRSTYENDIYGNKGGTGISAFQNDTFIVPNGVTTITVELWGGGGSGGAAVYGGDSDNPPVLGALAGNGGGGGYVKATLSVTPGETLIVRVGGGAWHYAANVIKHPSLTISGVLNSNILVVSRRTDQNLADQDLRGGIGGSGGGYSGIFRGNTPLLIAGGGGGGGGTNSYQQGGQSQGGSGGAGGGDIGQSGSNGYSSTSNSLTNTGYGGGGGTQSAGGAGGAGTTNSLCFSTNAESGGYLVGGRGKNSPEYQGNVSGSVLLVDNGTASNPGTNGGAAGGGSGRTNIIVCNGGSLGAIQVTTSTLYAPANCGGGGGGGYYGGGGGGVGRANVSIEDTSTGGGGGGGGSNYVGGALSVISNNQGTGTIPGNTTSSYYLTSYLYPPQAGIAGVPFNAFAQGGVGYGGIGGYTPPEDNTTINYGSRGENGLVVIYW